MTQGFNLEDIDIGVLTSTEGDVLPPLPPIEAANNESIDYNVSNDNRIQEFSTDNNDNVQNYDGNIDWGSLQPVDENGYRNPTAPDFESLKPYDVTEKPASIWDEAKVKLDLGNLTQYRSQLARDVMSGKMSIEDAKAATYGRHQEILNKYGISKVPEFSFAKFKQDPWRTVIGESVQMLPFYWGGTKKGAAASLVTTPAAIGKNMATGSVAGPGGSGAGIVSGLIEGVSNGMLIGTFMESMEVEGGNLYLDLREKGVSHESALGAGLAGGLLDGILETTSFGVMTAPIKGAAKKAAAKMLWDGLKNSPVMQKTFKGVVAKCATEYFKRVGTEATTEMIQDVVNNTMTLLAAQADSVEGAKPTAEDWKNIVTKTGPQTAAAMLLMGAFSTPFDVMNANVGSIKSDGMGEVGTKAEIEQNIKEVSEGKSITTGSQFMLEGGIAYDSVAEGQASMSELEAEFNESAEKISTMQKEVNKLESKKTLTEQDKEALTNFKNEIEYETEYQNLLKEEMTKTSEGISKVKDTQTRKNELQEKGKKEKLSASEMEELNNIWIEEEKAKGEKNIDERVSKARERELDKNIRDLDKEIQNSQKKEDKARQNRNKIEEQQDKNSAKISELEKENKEIEKALKNTDIEEDVAEMKTTLQKNREHIQDLKNNNKALKKQRIKYNTDIENAIMESEKLGDKRSALNEERSKISEGVINENGKVDITAGGYKNVQLSALKNKLKAMKEGIKRGVRLTRREIRDVQTTAIQLVKKSGMAEKDKNKFFNTIRDLNSNDKFNKALPDLLNKISKLEDKHNRKELGKYIAKLLKQAKPKKGGKRPVGKFNADIQRILDNITNAVNLSEEEVNKRVEEIFDNAGDKPLTDEQTEEVRILFTFGNMKNKTTSEMLRAARAIRMLVEEGKIAGEFREQAKKEHREKIKQEALQSIVGKVEPTNNRKLSLVNAVKQRIRSLGTSFDTWDGLMNIACLHDENRTLAKLLDVFPNKMKRITGEMKNFDKFARKAMEALGCKNTRQFNTKVKQDSIINDIGQYTDKDGNRVTLQASRAEARKLYMEMLDPTLRETLTEQNKYTFKEEIEGTGVIDDNNTIDLLFNPNTPRDRHFTIVDKSTQKLLEDFLTEEDMKLIQVELDFYRSYHSRLNEFYREKYGIDMPYNENYSPIARQVDGGDREGDWTNRNTYQKSMAPSNFISRKRNDKPLAFLNDIAVMQEHIANSEHFMAMDGFVEDANTIFGDYNIRQTIIDKYGKNFLATIDQHLKDIMNDGVQSTRPELGMIAKMRNMFTSSALGLRAKIFLTQMTAIGVFADSIGAADFAIGFADFLRHPREAAKILSQSYFLKDRANSINMEIKDIVRSQEFQAITRYKDFRQMFYFFTQMGDKMSIIAGGWAVYRSALKKTGSETKAMEAFERAADRYQQSGHIDNLSSWQRGGPFAKACVMFMSDQMRQMQREIHAIRDAIIFNDAKHIAKAAKTIVIMHFIMPNLVQFIANGFAWDDEDQLKATILGPFTATALLGQFISAGVSSALKMWGASENNEELKDINLFEKIDLGIFQPANKLFESINKLLNKMYEDEITSEDIIETLIDIGKDTVGPYTGIPIKYVTDVVQKYPEYRDEGEVIKQAKLLLGVSPYVIDNKGNREE